MFEALGIIGIIMVILGYIHILLGFKGDAPPVMMLTGAIFCMVNAGWYTIQKLTGGL